MNLSFNPRLAVAAALFLASGVLFSCQKSNDVNQEPLTEEQSTEYSSEALEADGSYEDVQDIAMTAAGEEGLEASGRGNDGVRVYVFARLRLRIGQCANISVSPEDGSYPKTVTIDFGNGCLGLDGKFRKGKIILVYTGPIRESGSVLTISLENFQLNRAKIEGTKIITNMSDNGNIKYTVAVEDGKVTFPGRRGYKYEQLKYVAQVQGGATDELSDDVYKIEGRSQTNFNNGLSVTLNTEAALEKKLACPWISNGLLKVKLNDRVSLLDYGYPNNGDCDNKALLSWNAGANTHVVVLP
ncbi:MAG: hypothetical protein ACK4E0_16895 [Chitinophagaceae bacterium]